MSLSILIPTYNTLVTDLVDTLCQQIKAANRQIVKSSNLDDAWEIIVIDDGSKDETVKSSNRQIQQFPHCRFIENKTNVGRAAIRNQLAKEAQFEWLLFIDADMQICSDNYLNDYIQFITQPQPAQVICGHYTLPTHSSSPSLREPEVAVPEQSEGGKAIGLGVGSVTSLRYLYEQRSLKLHSLAWRQQNPYRAFKVCNTVIHRSIFNTISFNQQITGYGYEDLLFAESLKAQGVPVTHIDNPVVFSHFESNEAFICKTEESLAQLARQPLQLSQLQQTAKRLTSLHLHKPFLLLYKHRKNAWRNKLINIPHSTSPSLREPEVAVPEQSEGGKAIGLGVGPYHLLQAYKLGYYLTLL